MDPCESLARWEVAGDAAEVHALLSACDSHLATPTAPAPVRNPGTTAARVAEGAVHLLRHGDEPVAMFTFTLEPPFDMRQVKWPKTRRPAYVSRLAVTPALLVRGTMLGLRCYRRAFELAAERDVDAVRLEANPDLVRIRELLQMLGFECVGQRVGEDGLKRVYLQMRLA